jgi:hypothetical protein
VLVELSQAAGGERGAGAVSCQALEGVTVPREAVLRKTARFFVLRAVIDVNRPVE